MYLMSDLEEIRTVPQVGRPKKAGKEAQVDTGEEI